MRLNFTENVTRRNVRCRRSPLGTCLRLHRLRQARREALQHGAILRKEARSRRRNTSRLCPHKQALRVESWRASKKGRRLPASLWCPRRRSRRSSVTRRTGTSYGTCTCIRSCFRAVPARLAAAERGGRKSAATTYTCASLQFNSLTSPGVNARQVSRPVFVGAHRRSACCAIRDKFGRHSLCL